MTIPEMKPVQSSQIAATGAEPLNDFQSTVFIQFKSGAIYRYDDVLTADYESLISAESVGKYFSSTFKIKYIGVKL